MKVGARKPVVVLEPSLTPSIMQICASCISTQKTTLKLSIFFGAEEAKGGTLLEYRAEGEGEVKALASTGMRVIMML